MILGANNCNIPHIVQTIAEALHRDVVDNDEEVKTRMLNIIKHIMVSLVSPQLRVPKGKLL